ncbi:MAG: alanine racemase [Pseudomonadota bacterium]
MNAVHESAAQIRTAGDRVVADISDINLIENIRFLRGLAGNRKIMQVVKADAYGHGIDLVAPVLAAEVDGMAVATIDEGIRLRDILLNVKHGNNCRIQILSGYLSNAHLDLIAEFGFDCTFHCREQIELFLSQSVHIESVWLEVETGMNRLGINIDCVAETVLQLKNSNRVSNIYLMTHLANADIIDEPTNRAQIERLQTLENLDLPMSISNSGGLLQNLEQSCQWIRPGISTFGVDPTESVASARLKPVMRLRSRIMSVAQRNPDDRVGYGGTYTCKEREFIAAVACGYADGYPRLQHDAAAVSVHGKRAPLAGRVSMDSLSVNVTDIENTGLGDWVELWGSHISVSDVARWNNTIPYELLCRISDRVPRRMCSEIDND